MAMWVQDVKKLYVLDLHLQIHLYAQEMEIVLPQIPVTVTLVSLLMVNVSCLYVTT